MSTKGFSRIFLFCLDLKLLGKIKKGLVSTHSQEPGFFIFLLITQDLKKRKKSGHPFVDSV